MWNASESPICARAYVKPSRCVHDGILLRRSSQVLRVDLAADERLAGTRLRVALVAGSPEFLKGQLHLHTGNSGDSATPPADVVRWYAARGYDFIVVTDHNVVTAAASPPAMLVIPGVELTQNVDRCAPPPPPGMRCLLHVNALFVTPPRDGKADVGGACRRTRLACRFTDARSRPRARWVGSRSSITPTFTTPPTPP